MKAAAIACALLAMLVAARADARGCHETSQVVGREHCTWFGTWSRDADVARMWTELGFMAHRYVSQPFAPSATADQLATLAEGAALRILGGIGPVFYVGGELDAGSLVEHPLPLGPTTTATVHTAGLAIAGAHVAVFRFGLSAELAAGGRYDSYNMCPDSACKSPTTASRDRRELEARGRLELYFHPRYTLMMTYGHSLIDAGDHSLMIGVGIHMRALDGAY